MRWPYTQQAALHTAGETNIFTLARLLVASVIGGLKAIHRWPQALPWCHDKLESSPPASPAMDPPSHLDSRDSLAVWLLHSCCIACISQGRSKQTVPDGPLATRGHPWSAWP